ncbi:polypeptide N-acetylgalactosaminyltransferase 16-like isoform X1 [Schistocerca piceifrons]|uniref:polypeptide N-acetylgalactosaminyltransferase 16-like isoform X1 n=1 Tax=Schistocerca piceifrons TaxID=274613 RepID=UPI001F5FAD5D|nr:polypeptide N-acetylgalactosaminyltransferase 16-like isoform X1 [Schistocerca piceifrons]
MSFVGAEGARYLRRAGCHEMRAARRRLRLACAATAGALLLLYALADLAAFSQRATRKVRTGGSDGAQSHLWAALVQQGGYLQGGAAANEPFSRHAFSAAASSRLRCDRPLPDTRHHSCREMTYTIDSDKTTSVVISFHNEARSALLRTVVSIINRTPAELLEEILLVDDFSDNEEDGTLLEAIPKVRVIRNTVREGLIRSRNIGASEARGNYLVFLDSHCEVNTGWLEPLLNRLSQNPLLVASPVIDVINQDTFEYHSSSSQLKGGFDWSLHFKWLPLSNEEKESKKDPSEPFTSPTIAGGLFLISKDWFHQLGAFDPGLEIWGAESLEISLKTWLCGGRLEIIPCSRVGHVFRKKHPYSFPRGNAQTYLRNSRRIADVWLEEYKTFFYEARPNAVDVEIGSLEERSKLKEQLQCKPFQWYLENIFPELRLPNEDSSAFGQLRQGSHCLQVENEKSPVSLALCSEMSTSQNLWAYNSHLHTIQHGKLCLAVPEGTVTPRLQTCHSSPRQEWSRHGRAVILTARGQCLETGIQSEVMLSECRLGALSQQWDFTVELQMQYDSSVRIT